MYAVWPLTPRNLRTLRVQSDDIGFANPLDDDDDDDDDDASMGKVMRIFGLGHSLGEGLHVITCCFGVWIWGMATVAFVEITNQCERYDAVLRSRCFSDMDLATVSYDECPKPGVSLNRLCDLADGALLALNLALGPHVLVMTALVMFTSIQVCLHTCCFGETTKKGAAFTCEPPAVAPPPLPFPASAHCMLHG